MLKHTRGFTINNMMDKIRSSFNDIFSESFMKSARRFGIFAIFYTIAFVAFFWTAAYTFPFIIAFIIALSIQPLVKLLKERIGISNGITSLIASVLVYILFFTLIFLLSYKMVSEAKQMLSTLTTIDINYVTQLVKEWISRFDIYLKYIDPDFINKNSSQDHGYSKERPLECSEGSLNKFLSAAGSIPLWIAVIFITIISTYFFTRDMDKIKNSTFGIFSEKGQQRVLNVLEEGVSLFVKIVKSYAIYI
uniref:Putative permease protein n=1 Tax=Peptoclostridium acidaminophilum TaxID=1731 RepID=Q8GCS6_PEPAC|nr:putative permease protein [Peptoclostridium acidaminophilum]